MLIYFNIYVETMHKTHIKHKGNTKEYHRAYYRLYEKPFNNTQDEWSEGRYKCVMCGFWRRFKTFNTIHQPQVKLISSGLQWNDLDLNVPQNKSVFNSYLNMIILFCRKFLAMYDDDYKNLLLTQEIRSYEKVNNYSSSHISNLFYEFKPSITTEINNVEVNQ